MRWIRRLLIMMLVGLVGGSVLTGCSGADTPPPAATAHADARQSGPQRGGDRRGGEARRRPDDQFGGRGARGQGAPAAARRLRRTADAAVAGALSAARLLRHLRRCVDPVHRHRATQPAVSDDHRDARGWRGGLLLRLGHRAEMGDLPHRRAARDAGGEVPRVLPAGDRRALHGRARRADVRRATSRSLRGGGLVQRNHPHALPRSRTELPRAGGVRGRGSARPVGRPGPRCRGVATAQSLRPG